MSTPSKQDQEEKALPLSRSVKASWLLGGLVTSALMIAVGMPLPIAIGWFVIDVAILAWLSRRAGAAADPRGPSGLT